MSNQQEQLDCADIQALLSALIDDRVDEGKRHAAERHLAGCDACREMIDEIERNEALIAADAESGSWRPGQLPDGFEAAVLSRTVYETYRRPSHLTTWIGWMATAALLFLVVSLWIVDRSRTSTPGGETRAELAQTTYTPPAWESWAHDGTLSQDTLRELQPVEAAGSGPSLSRTDAETLESASLMLAMLQEADVQSFADVEEVRRATEYDNLLPRMAQARRNVSDEDQALLFAAESVLYRVVQGPLSLDDARELRDYVSKREMARRLNEIGGSPLISASSL